MSAEARLHQMGLELPLGAPVELDLTVEVS